MCLCVCRRVHLNPGCGLCVCVCVSYHACVAISRRPHCTPLPAEPAEACHTHPYDGTLSLTFDASHQDCVISRAYRYPHGISSASRVPISVFRAYFSVLNRIRTSLQLKAARKSLSGAHSKHLVVQDLVALLIVISGSNIRCGVLAGATVQGPSNLP